MNELDQYSTAETRSQSSLPAEPAAGAGMAASAAPTMSAPPDGPARANGTVGRPDGGTEAPLGSRNDTPVLPSPSDVAGTVAPLTDAATPAPACAASELLGPSGACYFLDPEMRNLFSARSACQARGDGWDLASVRSPAESQFLAETLGFEAWLGASDNANEGTWLWLDDGMPFWSGEANGAAIDGAYANWSAGEPSGGMNMNCMRAMPSPDAAWADLACFMVRGAICRVPPR